VLLATGAAALAVFLVAAGVTFLLGHSDPNTTATAVPHPLSSATAPAAAVVGPSATPTPTPTATTPKAKPKAEPKKTTNPAAPVRRPAAGSLLLSDRFGGKAGAGWGLRWVMGRNPDSGSGGGATLRGGMGRISTSDLGNYSGSARTSRRADIPNLSDVDVRFTFRFDRTESFPALFIRANRVLDSKSGDYLYLGRDGSYDLGRDVGYQDSGPLPTVGDGATAATYPFVAGATYDVHLAAVGHDLYASVWPSTGKEPAQWALHVRDPGSVLSGAVGFTIGGGKAATPSNWFVDDVAIRRATP
jgi:hypothetical protein